MSNFMKCPHCGENSIWVPKSDTHVNGFDIPYGEADPPQVVSVPKNQKCPACQGWAQLTRTYVVSLRMQHCAKLMGQDPEAKED